LTGTLYIVATPIGNAADITDRAKQFLTNADVVAAEDTRTTQTLFHLLGIKNKTVSNHKFNEKRQVDFLVSQLENGKNVALVSDAGTPCISDPGGVIVKAAADRGIRIVGVCGASSVITALSVCGFSFGSFTFYGFLPKETKEIRKTIETAAKSISDVSVFFESPKRIIKTLGIFADEAPETEICLCNDLTKKYERIYRGKPQSILDELLANPSAEKGEYTFVASLGGESEPVINDHLTLEAMIIDHIVKNSGSIKDAVQSLAGIHKGHIMKKEFYAASLNLRSLF